MRRASRARRRRARARTRALPASSPTFQCSTPCRRRSARNTSRPSDRQRRHNSKGRGDSMLSYREREKLMREYRGAPARGAGLVLKCAAGLLLLIGVALIGTSDDRSVEPGRALADAGRPVAERSLRVADEAAGAETAR